MMGLLALLAGAGILLFLLWRGLSSVAEDWGWTETLKSVAHAVWVTAAVMAAAMLIVYGFFSLMGWPLS